MRSGTETRRDALALVVALALYAANQYLLKPLVGSMESAPAGSLTGPAGALRLLWALRPLVTGHLNDALGGFAFMCYTNLLFDLVRPARRLHGLRWALPYMLLCGLFWECAAPLFVPGSVGDPLDLVAYLVGAALYCTVDAVAPASSSSSSDGSKR